MEHRFARLALVLAAGLLAACAPPNYGAASYYGTQARQIQQVQLGVVEAVREVEIQDNVNTGIGTFSGAALGGIAGSMVGQGRGAAAAAIGGALLGGVLGNAADQQIARVRGQEITVRLDGGRLVAVTQGLDAMFKSGDRVRVLSSADGEARVTYY